jgi:hypothetical protein
MAETAALPADQVLPERPLRQWVLSLPFVALRFLLATDPDSLTRVMRTDVTGDFWSRLMFPKMVNEPLRFLGPPIALALGGY